MRSIYQVQITVSTWGSVGTAGQRLWVPRAWSPLCPALWCVHAGLLFRGTWRRCVTCWWCLGLVFRSSPRAVLCTWHSGSVSCSTSSSGGCPSCPRSRLPVSSLPPVSLLCHFSHSGYVQPDTQGPTGICCRKCFCGFEIVSRYSPEFLVGQGDYLTYSWN